MSSYPAKVRIRLWTGVIIGILLGYFLGILMESVVYGIIIGIVGGITLGSRWAKAGMNKESEK
ncbi:hypothetical protein B6I21_06280 [candidate division KSB1 bacterium 4572_119]|nr:MAG: hypothetical protein B6I21_06280 [candidate division KSB1 bacterium 4572_119]